MLNEKYAENATFFVEEFVVWAHNEKISFVQEGGKRIGPMTILNLYGELLHQRQADMNRHVEKCRHENICVSCGEPGFPYCAMHMDVDEGEIAKMFPASADGNEGYEHLLNG